LRRLAELDRRRSFERDGFSSAAAWFVSRLRVGWGAARVQMRHARCLEQMPATRAALEGGEVSLSGVRVLASAREADPEAFAAAGPALVEAARIHSVADLMRVLAYWRQAVEAPDRVGRTSAPPPGGGPMPWGRSVASGSIAPIGPRLPVSGRISRSRWEPMCCLPGPRRRVGAGAQHRASGTTPVR
jgi:hypothetical protein